MKISVVTVCLNSGTDDRADDRVVLKQTYANKEMLVIDGVSRDRTVEIARSFGSDAIRVFSESDRGIYDAMNKGFRRFGGDAVGFLGSDDMFHSPRSLELMAASLQSADVVYGDVHVVKDHLSKTVLRTQQGGAVSSSGTSARLDAAAHHVLYQAPRRRGGGRFRHAIPDWCRLRLHLAHDGAAKFSQPIYSANPGRFSDRRRELERFFPVHAGAQSRSAGFRAAGRSARP